MQADYDVRALDAADVLRAFAIMRTVMPWLVLERWRDLTATDTQRRKWLAAMDDDGYIHGLCYAFSRDATPVERHLEVPVFAPVSLFDENSVASALLETVIQRAISEGCDKVHIWAEAPSDWESLMAKPVSAAGNQGLVLDVSTGGRQLH